MHVAVVFDADTLACAGMVSLSLLCITRDGLIHLQRVAQACGCLVMIEETDASIHVMHTLCAWLGM